MAPSRPDDLRCTVFVGASIDGFIARPDHGLDFLDGPGSSAGDAPDGPPEDSGYEELLASVDGLVMGRTTYDVVRRMTDEWPYPVPVVVLTSRSLEAPAGADVRATTGTAREVAGALVDQGWSHAYVDGGAVIEQFLAADLVDRITITTIPVLVGDGVRLFGRLDGDRWFTPDPPRLLGRAVQTTYHRDRAVG